MDRTVAADQYTPPSMPSSSHASLSIPTHSVAHSFRAANVCLFEDAPFLTSLCSDPNEPILSSFFASVLLSPLTVQLQASLSVMAAFPIDRHCLAMRSMNTEGSSPSAWDDALLAHDQLCQE